jgi:hypothetical protein
MAILCIEPPLACNMIRGRFYGDFAA